MGWGFRKSKKVGPFRITASKKGITLSGGIKGLRTSVNTRGERHTTVSIPGTGFFFRQKHGPKGRGGQESQADSGTSCFGCLGGLGVVLLCLVCCCSGLATFSWFVPETRTASTQHPANANTPLEHPQPSDVEESDLDEIDKDAPPPRTDTPGQRGEPDLQLPESSTELHFREWSDDTGNYSVEAALKGYKDQQVVLVKKDLSEIAVPFGRLSEVDKDHVRRATQQNIPCVLRGRVTAVLAANVISVKGKGSRTERVLLKGVEARSTESRKVVADLVFSKDVTVIWYERSKNISQQKSPLLSIGRRSNEDLRRSVRLAEGRYRLPISGGSTRPPRIQRRVASGKHG